MKFIITDDQNIHQAKDKLVVVIDVLRAFTTACYVMNNNPKDYIIVSDLSQAYELKKENPDYILMGERDGKNLPGFDYGNSPAEIKNLDFSGKTIVQTTTLGTKGVVSALKHTKEIITGSFTNAKAIINYIKKENPKIVYLFCTDSRPNDNEDLMLAKYIKGYFENKMLDINVIRENLIKQSQLIKSGVWYLFNSKGKYAKSDFSLALEPDKFDFVMKIYLDKNKLVHLKRIECKN